MKKILRSALVSAAVGTIGLAACDDSAPPPNASVSRPSEPEAIAADETLADANRQALEDIIRDNDPYSRARRLGALLPTLGPEAVPAVRQMLANPGYAFILGATEIDLLVRYWATQQPEEASRWAVEKSPLAYRYNTVMTSVMAWAKADPQAAVIATQEWVPRQDVGEAAEMALVFGWFESNDLPGLQQYLRDLGPGIAQQRAITGYVRALLRSQGIEATMAWASSVPKSDAAYKTAVYRQVASWLTMTDVAAGLRWCEAQCDGPYGKEMRRIIATFWSRSDPKAALAWLLGGPEGDERNFALRVVFEQWVRLDREAAIAWMKSQTSGEPAPQLRSMFPVYARALAKDSPAEAIPWAQQVVDEAERELLLIQIASAWRRLDEAAAEAWLLQSPLSEEALEKVRAPAPGS